MTLQEELNYWNELYYNEITSDTHDEVRSAQLNDYRKECLKELNGIDIGEKTRPNV